MTEFICDYWDSVEDVGKEFEADLSGLEILVAYYEYECYEGDAWVLFREGEDLFEVSAGHCSCHGLEGQWEPSATSKTYLLSENFPHRDNEKIMSALERMI